MGLIEWLSDRFYNLWMIVEYLYDAIVAVAEWGINGIISFVTSTVTSWYQAAVGLIRDVDSRLSQVDDWLNEKTDRLEHWFNQRIDGVVLWADGVMTAIQISITSWVDGLVGGINEWVSSIYNELAGWIQDTWQYADDLFNQVGETIQGAYTWFTDQFNQVQAWAYDAITGAFNQVYTVFDAFRSTWEAPLTAFFSDPAAFLWSLIEAYVYPWADWYLGKILWGAEGEPPERPNISGGGFNPSPSIPPTEPGSGERFIFPSDVTSISGYVFNPPHYGVDFGTPTGTTIRAVASGVVQSAGWSQVGYGNMVSISHAGDDMSLYAHLQTVLVSVGSQVSQGQAIGTADSTGNSTGPHLHFELKVAGSYVNPMLWLGH